MANGTHKAFLLTVMGASVRMLDNAIREIKTAPNGSGVDVAIEVDPLAAIL